MYGVAGERAFASLRFASLHFTSLHFALLRFALLRPTRHSIKLTHFTWQFGLIPKECSKYFASTTVTSGAKFATKQEELDAISKAMDGMDPGAIALAKEAAMKGHSHTGKAKLQRRYTGGMARN